MTTLDGIREGWDNAARDNAMYAILTVPGLTPDGFFEAGRHEIARLIEHLDTHKLGRRRQRALDFGCGIGRLSVALADHYREVVGVDISQEMVDRATPHDRVEYRRADSLKGLGRFDLVYSNIVLQHMPNDLQEGYVKQIVGVLRPKGVAVFEVPEGSDVSDPFPGMYGTHEDVVRGWVEAAKGRVVTTVRTGSAGPNVVSVQYTAVRA